MKRRNYLLAVLFVVQVFNCIDGVALGLVMEDIKLDLTLTDTQLGLLTGIAFALMYSVVGIAIARWADRGDRVAILSITAVVWSILVALCGAATNFLQLFLLRVGVGIGEAGCVPASQSLIADHFDRAERPRANGVYIMTAGVTYLVGYGLAGWLNQLYGWRVMFMVLGLPGVAVAILVRLTLRDPRFEHLRGIATVRTASTSLLGTTVARSQAPAPPHLKEVGSTLWTNMTLFHLLFFWSAWSFLSAGLGQWLPAFFVRSHGLNTRELGFWFAIAYGLGGTLGPFLGGAWASRYAANNERRQLKVAGVVCCGVMIFWILICSLPNYYWALGSLGLYAVGLTAFFGLFWATIQTLVPENMRAAVTAILMLVGSLVGRGLGPLATGVLSDALPAQLGTESLRYALLLESPGFLWAAYHLWRASKSVARDLALTQGQNESGDSHIYAANASSTVGA